MSNETNILALDTEVTKEKKAFGYLPFELLVKSGFSLGASLNEARGDSEILLIEGSLRVSF
ncbi:MAG: hypothetical protein P4L16_03980 [Chlamydiales bacterium]|nr:hypothetical protein [Chlamydiales bacterium]